MPEMITARVSNAEYAEVAAIAGILDVSVSQLVRESTFDRLPEWKAKAQAAFAKRGNLPHGVTKTMTEDAADALVKSMNRSEAIHLDLAELFSAKSKAIYQLLAFVWQEQPSDVSRKALDHVAERVKDRLARIRPGGADNTSPPPGVIHPAPDEPRKKVRNYPRRGSKS